MWIQFKVYLASPSPSVAQWNVPHLQPQLLDPVLPIVPENAGCHWIAVRHHFKLSVMVEILGKRGTA